MVKNGCLEMMKSAVRQQRHNLKKDFFDPFPLHLVTKTSPVKSTSNDEWIALVEMWKNPKKNGMSPYNQTLPLHMIHCHMSNMYSAYDVGGMSKEQR